MKLTERQLYEALQPWQDKNEQSLTHGKFVIESFSLRQIAERLNKTAEDERKP